MDQGLVTVGEIPFSRADLAEAAEWMARLRADDRTEEDIQAFQRWFASGTAHFAAFEHVTAVWEAVPARRPSDTPKLARRGVLAGIGALVVAGGVLGYRGSAQAHILKTDVGEQKHVVLEDGTQLFLDTDTCCAVDFTKEKRAVDLRYGRAGFRISADNRGFEVQSAANTVRAAQSRFDVRRDRDSSLTSVTMIQGRAYVDIRPPERVAETRELTAGQQLLAAAAGTASVTDIDLAQVLAWQRGQAIFENTSLAEAVYEMNRYSTNKLKIAAPGIDRLRISGVYTFGDNDAFAGTIARLLPVKASFDRGHHRIELTSAGGQGTNG